MYHIFFFIYSLVEGHLCCFQLLAIINKAAMNHNQANVLMYGRAFFGYKPKSGIAGS